MKNDEETGSKNIKAQLISQKTFDEMDGEIKKGFGENCQ